MGSSSAETSQPVCAYYPIRSGLPQLKAYLKGERERERFTANCGNLVNFAGELSSKALLYFSDMGALQLEVGLGHMRDASMVIGRANVANLTALPVEGSLFGYVDFHTSHRTHSPHTLTAHTSQTQLSH